MPDCPPSSRTIRRFYMQKGLLIGRAQLALCAILSSVAVWAESAEGLFFSTRGASVCLEGHGGGKELRAVRRKSPGAAGL